MTARGLFLSLACLAAFSAPAMAQDTGHGGHETAPVFNMIKTELGYDGRKDGKLNWDVDGWIGGDFERVWIRSEGSLSNGRVEDAEAQLYYGWNVDTFWDALIGVRQDFEPRGRTYLATSLVGLAPYFFETEASLFLSYRGDVSARFKQSFDLLLTQRLIAEPSFETNLFAQDVREDGIGAGFSDVKAKLQLRYEITRKFAPYVEVEWKRDLGETARLTRANGGDVEENAIRVGLRFWF
jgi:copper resistance protein B